MSPEAEHLASVTLELPAETLRFEDGDVVIVLTDDATDTLVLHSSVLSAASPRFKARFGKGWGETGLEKIQHPESGKEVDIYKYCMAYMDGGFTITDSQNAAKQTYDDSATSRFFSSSDLCTGCASMPIKDGDLLLGLYPISQVLAATAEDHKLLFWLVYNRTIHINGANTSELIDQIVDIVALAEYYELLPAIAEQLQETIHDLPSLWKHAAELPLLYLALGKKLRSKELFVDALKHFVGQGRSFKDAMRDDVLTMQEACIAVLPAKEWLEEQSKSVIDSLHRATLTPYQAHADRVKRQRGPMVSTTWLGAGFEHKSTEQKCRWLAGSVMNEWLTQQLSGQPHWSHVKFAASGKKDGNVEGGSLRKASETLLASAEAKANLDFLGDRVAKKYSDVFHLDREQYGPHHPAGMITRELRSLIRSAAWAIGQYLPELTDRYPYGCGIEDNDNPYCMCYQHLKPAHYTSGLRYLTGMRIPDDSLPWKSQAPWVEVKLPAVNTKPATQEWLRVVGMKV